MNFIVVISCIAGMACPLPRTLATPFTATSVSDCYYRINRLLSVYRYDPRAVHFTCKRK